MTPDEQNLDMLVAELDRENRLLRARNEQLEREAEQAARQDADAYGYAKRLAENIWQKHYKEGAPHWRPFDDLIGVISQIDNMTCRLVKPSQAAQQAPVAGQCRFECVDWSSCSVEHVRMVLENPQEWARYEVRYLYAEPPAKP